MKKFLLLFGIILLAGSSILAQAPQAFKYQAIARDIEGNVIADQQVSLKINLLQGSESGQAVYSETHVLRTNSFGLINLEIGNGNNKTGNFADINWGLSKYFINIEMDANGGSNYKNMGVSPLLSVPYALYAETSGSGNSAKSDDDWVTSGNNTTISNTAAKVGISNTSPGASLHVIGTAVNAIYERSINAIGSATNRFYKSRGTTAAKTPVLTGDYLGSFQWWGYTSDGNFHYSAVLGSLAETVSSSDVAGNFVFLTKDNSFNYAERMRITADGDVGIATTAPSEKLDVAGNINFTGDLRNTGIPIFSLGLPGVSNTFVGQTFNTTNIGSDNTFLGFMAGSINTPGFFNTFLGSNAGALNISGNSNTFVGYGAGITNSQGNYSICLGHNAGPVAGDIDHKLYINHQAGVPLIYGDFNNVEVGIATTNPTTNFTIYESNTHLNPALLINQAGTGDAAMRYVNSAGGKTFSTGIDSDDNFNWKITTAVNLGSNQTPPYNDPWTMMRIHNENPQPGIIDFNHQSRARVYLTSPNVVVPPNIWFPIPFDASSYDEHFEWPASPVTPNPTFTALEEGYYQVNARTQFLYYEGTTGGYCSIAIFKIDASGATMYAQGNNLELRGGWIMIPGYPDEVAYNNNAPNVSDVVYLKAGEQVEIHVFHNYPLMQLPLNVFDFTGAPGPSQTYCSIHKVS